MRTRARPTCARERKQKERIGISPPPLPADQAPQESHPPSPGSNATYAVQTCRTTSIRPARRRGKGRRYQSQPRRSHYRAQPPSQPPQNSPTSFVLNSYAPQSAASVAALKPQLATLPASGNLRVCT